jgi:hypothetical protein
MNEMMNDPYYSDSEQEDEEKFQDGNLKFTQK